MLPFEPETETSIQHRFPAALETVFDVDDVAGGVRPGLLRQHIFDFENGVRLIASTDRDKDGHLFTHLSFSANPAFPWELAPLLKECLRIAATLVGASRMPIIFNTGRALHLVYPVTAPPAPSAARFPRP